MVTASRADDGLVGEGGERGWRMGPALGWLAWSTGGQDTSTQGEAGNNKLIAISLPEISLPCPDSELSFLPTLREFSLDLSSPPGQSIPAILLIPVTMSSQMKAFDCQGSPNRSDSILIPHLFIRSDSTPFQPYFTPPDFCGGMWRTRQELEGILEESKDSSSGGNGDKW
jgi:hypothetical protein